MGHIKHILLGALFSVACSSPNGSTGSGEPKHDSSADLGSSGTQTGGEGSVSSCRSVSISEVDADQARALGFPVDEQLPLFEQTFEAPFHRGELSCAARPVSTDGHVQIHASLQRMEWEKFVPAAEDAPCPTPASDLLWYRAVITLTTDDGTLSGSFETKAAVKRVVPGTDEVKGLYFSASVPLSALSGSLGVRVDASRAHAGHLGIKIALGDTPWASEAFTLVDYTDGEEPIQDQGDALFWPATFAGATTLTSECDVPQTPSISIDAYNQL
jgi:hypothetical protein